MLRSGWRPTHYPNARGDHRVDSPLVSLVQTSSVDDDEQLLRLQYGQQKYAAGACLSSFQKMGCDRDCDDRHRRHVLGDGGQALSEDGCLTSLTKYA
jgi:hypothetical protein